MSILREAMESAGAEMAYKNCVYDHWKRHAARTIHGEADIFDNFYEITGKQPTTRNIFIEKHRAELNY